MSLPSRACIKNEKVSHRKNAHQISTRRESFTLAKMEVQMGSTSWILAAPRRVWSLSAYIAKEKSPISSQFILKVQC